MSDDVTNDLENVQAAVPDAIALFKNNPRLIGFIVGVLSKLAGLGVPNAAKYRDALLSIPGILDWLNTNLPKIIWAAKEFAPAPRPGPPITGADWSHGFPTPQPVTNPSGAIGGDPS